MTGDINIWWSISLKESVFRGPTDNTPGRRPANTWERGQRLLLSSPCSQIKLTNYRSRSRLYSPPILQYFGTGEKWLGWSGANLGCEMNNIMNGLSRGGEWTGCWSLVTIPGWVHHTAPPSCPLTARHLSQSSIVFAIHDAPAHGEEQSLRNWLLV